MGGFVKIHQHCRGDRERIDWTNKTWDLLNKNRITSVQLPLPAVYSTWDQLEPAGTSWATSPNWVWTCFNQPKWWSGWWYTYTSENPIYGNAKMFETTKQWLYHRDFTWIDMGVCQWARPPKGHHQILQCTSLRQSSFVCFNIFNHGMDFPNGWDFAWIWRVRGVPGIG